jgi:hypothetical protein
MLLIAGVRDALWRQLGHLWIECPRSTPTPVLERHSSLSDLDPLVGRRHKVLVVLLADDFE